MSWAKKKLIEYVDKYLTDKMLIRLEKLGKIIDKNRTQIDIIELVSIDKKIDIVEEEIKKSIRNDNNLPCQEASKDEQDELSKNLDKHLIP